MMLLQEFPNHQFQEKTLPIESIKMVYCPWGMCSKVCGFFFKVLVTFFGRDALIFGRGGG